MPFNKKYKNSGITKLLRIPEKDILFVIEMLEIFNIVRDIKDDKFVEDIKNKIIVGLKNIQE